MKATRKQIKDRKKRNKHNEVKWQHLRQLQAEENLGLNELLKGINIELLKLEDLGGSTPKEDVIEQVAKLLGENKEIWRNPHARAITEIKYGFSIEEKMNNVNGC